jgi:pyrroline-5-carboxylate reductase
MATALGRAIVAAAPDTRITAFDTSDSRLREFRGLFTGFVPSASNAEVAATSDVTFIAVKPQVIDDVLAEIAKTTGLIVSIAAGVTIEHVEKLLPSARVVRVMPNTPCLVGAMAAGYAAGSRATERDTDLVGELLSRAGEAIRLDERLLDAVTGLSGSGPAFVARLIEAFSQAGVAAGLDAEVARRLTLATFAGTARLLSETGMDPEALVAMVSSPGGTTIAGREILEASDFRDVIRETVLRSTERSRELGS